MLPLRRIIFLWFVLKIKSVLNVTNIVFVIKTKLSNAIDGKLSLFILKVQPQYDYYLYFNFLFSFRIRNGVYTCVSSCPVRKCLSTSSSWPEFSFSSIGFKIYGKVFFINLKFIVHHGDIWQTFAVTWQYVHKE